MAGEVIWAPSAKADLLGILEFIARDSHQQALHVSQRILHAVDRLAVMPHMGRLLAISPEYRQIIWRSFRIVYRVEHEGRVRILAVVHGAKDWSLKDLPDQTSMSE